MAKEQFDQYWDRAQVKHQKWHEFTEASDQSILS